MPALASQDGKNSKLILLFVLFHYRYRKCPQVREKYSNEKVKTNQTLNYFSRTEIKNKEDGRYRQERKESYKTKKNVIKISRK